VSIRLVTWAFKQELPCAEKLVLVALAHMADKDGKCWPSQAGIAQHCGITRETVNRMVGILVEAGLVRVERRFSAKGRAANLYLVGCV